VQVSITQKTRNPSDGAKRHQELVLHPEHMDDSLLWQAFRSGDEKALITIFDRFVKPMYNYGYKIVGEIEFVKDSVQDLLIELWQKRDRLGETDSIKFYLFKSLRRKLIRSKSKSENRLLNSLSFFHNDKEVVPSHEFVMVAEQVSLERRELVIGMLDKLTKRQREVIFLRYFEELNCDQIAQVMELSKQAVYNLLHHALDELKKVH